MHRNDRTPLNYTALVKKARKLEPPAGIQHKIALLADVSTQHLVPLLRVLFADAGVEAETYEAGFDTVEAEALNSGSGLYKFAPHTIVVLQGTMKLKGSFYHATGKRSTFVPEHAASIESVWSAIRAHSQAVIVQSTFAMPYERPFGNFGRLMEDDLVSTVAELNREICLRARKHRSVLINDIEFLSSWVGRRYFFDEKLWGMAKTLCALEFLPDVAQNIVDITLAASGCAIKCAILDLDNTLWGGVVGDDGLDGIGLGDLDEDGAFRSFQLYLRELAARGIILAVCSKNNEAVAREVFQKHPAMILKEEHIAVFMINWEDKATNIRRIRETLNIGFDAMVFLDDNPFERNLVRQLIPDIIVPELPEDPALYVRTISELNLFETAAHSALDANRSALYQDQQKREVESKNFGTLEGYLKSLDTKASVQRFADAALPRITQLILRSNQFNLTTRRYSEAECQVMMEDREQYFPFTISVRDRFGDFGLINVVVLRRSPAETVLEIETFLMSCRVLQRGVEQLAMNRIFEFAGQGGFKEVVGHYIPTAKNGMVKAFYEQFGFRQTGMEADGTTHWRMATDEYRTRQVFIDSSGE